MAPMMVRRIARNAVLEDSGKGCQETWLSALAGADSQRSHCRHSIASGSGHPREREHLALMYTLLPAKISDLWKGKAT